MWGHMYGINPFCPPARGEQWVMGWDGTLHQTFDNVHILQWQLPEQFVLAGSVNHAGRRVPVRLEGMVELNPYPQHPEARSAQWG